jgi:cyclic pyranopterin phosphate synthase
MTAPARNDPASDSPLLVDGRGRTVDHLRLSLTDHCNLACRYCTPRNTTSDTTGIEPGFALALVRWLSERHGVCHVRITGGEPLLYPHLIEEITLTTNAQALAGKAPELRKAGVSRVNISLDTLDPDLFARITGGGRIAHTLLGIEAAVDAGLWPVRINVVVQRGVNEHELPDIAAWGLARGCVVRFLEVMPIGPFAHVADRHLVPASEVLDRLSRRFRLRPVPHPAGQPATDYAASAPGLRGVIGVIASTTRPFCSSCRRIRITAQGRMLTCLFDRRGVGLKGLWNGRELDEAGADAVLQAAVEAKPAEGERCQPSPMAQIGG